MALLRVTVPLFKLLYKASRKHGTCPCNRSRQGKHMSKKHEQNINVGKDFISPSHYALQPPSSPWTLLSHYVHLPSFPSHRNTYFILTLNILISFYFINIVVAGHPGQGPTVIGSVCSYSTWQSLPQRACSLLSLLLPAPLAPIGKILLLLLCSLAELCAPGCLFPVKAARRSLRHAWQWPHRQMCPLTHRPVHWELHTAGAKFSAAVSTLKQVELQQLRCWPLVYFFPLSFFDKWEQKYTMPGPCGRGESMPSQVRSPLLLGLSGLQSHHEKQSL